MKQKNIIILLLILSVSLLFSQIDTSWTKKYYVNNYGTGKDIIQTHDSCYVLIADIQNIVSNWSMLDICLIKTNNVGDTLWTKIYGDENDDFGDAIIQTNDGGFAILGGRTTTDMIWLIKTDVYGNTLWTKNFGWGEYCGGYSIIQIHDGGFVITGSLDPLGEDISDIVLIRTDANGEILWEKTYNNGIEDRGIGVIQTNDNDFIIAGSTMGINPDIWLIKTDLNGDILWTQSIDGGYNEWAYSIVNTHDGGYAIGGSIQINNETDFLLVKTNKDGEVLWTKNYTGYSSDWFRKVIQTINGGYVLVGRADNPDNPICQSILSIKTDINGNVLWSRTFNGTSDTGGNSIIQTNDGGFAITGVAYGEHFKNNVLLLKTSTDKPAPVQNFNSINENSAITLNWEDYGTDIKEYKIYRRTESSVSTLLDTISSKPLLKEYHDNNVTNGTLYYYKIISVNNFNAESNFTDEISGRPDTPPVWSEIPYTTINEDSYLEFDIDDYLSDEFDENSELTITIPVIENLKYEIDLLTNIVKFSPYLNQSDFNESITLIATDPWGLSSIYTFSVYIAPINDAPIAVDTLLSTYEDSTLEISLIGTDADYEALDFWILDSTSHGILNGEPPSINYIPDTNYNGYDSLHFIVYDGNLTDTGTVIINVLPINDSPVAFSYDTTTFEDQSLTIIFDGSNDDGTVVYSVLDSARHGRLSGNLPEPTYSPDLNYFGDDSIHFLITDNVGAKDTGSIVISITSVNDAPVADNNQLAAYEETLLEITLSASDVDNEDLYYSILDSTSHGILNGEPPSINYIPDTNYNGYDSLRFIVYDGNLTDTGTVIINVLPINDSPVAYSYDTTTFEDQSLTIIFDGSDDDGTVVYSVLDSARHGRLSGNLPEPTYSPDLNYFGDDSIHFLITDNVGAKDTGSIVISITSVNDAPVATLSDVLYNEGDTRSIILTANTGALNESTQSLQYILRSIPQYGYLCESESGSEITQNDIPLILSDSNIYFYSPKKFVETSFIYSVQDNGGTEYGGIDTSLYQTLAISMSVATKMSLTSSGSIEGGVTILGDNTLYAPSSGDKVYRFDTTGTAMYSLNVDGNIKSSTTITSDHNVYIASTDYNLYSFNSNGLSNSGWPKALGSEATASVAIDSYGNCYIGTENGIFQCIAPNGTINWGYNVGAAVYASSAISNSNILYIVNTNGKLYAFDLNGLNLSAISPKWTYEINDPISSSPALDLDDNLYITTESGKIIKLHDNGSFATELWNIDTDQKYIGSPVISSNGNLFIGGESKILYALKINDGEIIWQDTLLGKIKSTASLNEQGTDQDRLYVGDDTGKLYAIYKDNGDIIWRYQADSSISCPILYANNHVYFGTMSGDIISIEDKFDVNGLAKATTEEISSIWPTFQGNNRRTGNQVDLNTSVSTIPGEFILKQNYPNPFNPFTKIEYSLPSSVKVELNIFDITGRKIKEWNKVSQQPGWHEVIWDGTDMSGNMVSTGVYIYSLRAGDFIDTKKMIFMK